MKKGIYLGACRAYHPNFDLDYNDIKSGYHINIVSDMLDIDLSNYDFIVATPPCNYYSRANYRREISKYALDTKHLLPCILLKCIKAGKPFIIENVKNFGLFKSEGIIDICINNGIFYYFYGRHTYFTNIMFNPSNIIQRQDFKTKGYVIKYGDDSSKYNQGGFNVHNVIEFWLETVCL